MHFDSIPEQLRAYDHWVVWRYAIVDGEIKKPPFSPRSGKHASVSSCETWGSFQEAQTVYETGQYAGVGIVLFHSMGIVGIDVDHCIVDGKPTKEVQQMITSLDSYAEVSPSGKGVRILLAGNLPGALRRRGNVEMYDTLRYLTITGQWIAHTPQELQQRQRELYNVYQRVFHSDTREPVPENTGGVSGQRPRFHYEVSRSDEAVLQKALKAKNGEHFKRYFVGDTSLWEGAGARHQSQSEADFTLVLMLLYWTNNDMTQVNRLFQQSGLMREKWTRPIKGSETYGERIIKDAIRKGRR